MNVFPVGPEPQTVAARALALVTRTPDGLVSSTAALVLGVSWATAACALGRLYWAGLVDRHWDQRHYRYTIRGPQHDVREAAVEG